MYQTNVVGLFTIKKPLLYNSRGFYAKGVMSYTLGKSPSPFNGNAVSPIKYLSTWCAACLPSEIAHTINDCPLLWSPAAKTPGTLVL